MLRAREMNDKWSLLRDCVDVSVGYNVIKEVKGESGLDANQWEF